MPWERARALIEQRWLIVGCSPVIIPRLIPFGCLHPRPFSLAVRMGHSNHLVHHLEVPYGVARRGWRLPAFPASPPCTREYEG